MSKMMASFLVKRQSWGVPVKRRIQDDHDDDLNNVKQERMEKGEKDNVHEFLDEEKRSPKRRKKLRMRRWTLESLRMARSETQWSSQNGWRKSNLARRPFR